MKMNSGEVSKLLGVSVSTIQRWVKQLELPMERNERGHYIFSEEDVDLLKQIHKKIQEGVLLQEIAPQCDKKFRKGSVKTEENDKSIEMLMMKLNEFETRLNTKADSVASYQLLQHRNEIEDLKNQVQDLISKISELEGKVNPPELPGKPPVLEQSHKEKKKPAKKKLVSSLFGFLANMK
jgi:chromosome-anchoring protein RacA